MKFAENNRISHRQLYRQIILSLAAPFLLCMSGKDWPYASGGLDDGNGLLGLVLALVVLGFYVVFLIRLEPYFGDLTKAAGGFPGRGLHGGERRPRRGGAGLRHHPAI